MKIALICAFNENLNTGMISVDAAALSFLSRLPDNGNVELHLYNCERAHSFIDLPDHGNFSYALLTDPIAQLADYDRIVFWGDFLHAKGYHTQDFTWRQRRRGMTDAQALDSAFRGLMFEGAPREMLERTLVFGGTLYTNTLAEEDPRYRAAAAAIYTQAPLALMRDPASAAHIQRLSGFTRTDALGVDCAFLLDSADVFRWAGLKPASPGRKFHIGYSFGRSPNRAAMLFFTRRLRDRLAADQVDDIEWLGGEETAPLPKLADRLNKLRACRLVVTDTYHCAMNAWREGVPAICIGQGAQRASFSLNDKKKEIAYKMFGISDHYVYSELLTTQASTEKQAEAAARAILGAGSKAAVQEIALAARAAERKLVRALGLALES